MDVGSRHVRRGQLTDALTFLQAAVARYPSSAAPHNALALAYEQHGELQEARKHLASALALGKKFGDPDRPTYKANHERVSRKLSSQPR